MAEPLFSNLVYRLHVADGELPALKRRINTGSALVLAAIAGVSVLANLAGGVHVHPFLHSLFESYCGLISLVISYVLGREYRASGKRSTLYLFAAFCSMGVFDFFHTFSNHSTTLFVWFHSLSAASGGVFFALSAVSSKRPPADPPWLRGALIYVGGGLSALGAWYLVGHPEVLPVIGSGIQPHAQVDRNPPFEFSAAPVAVNLLAAGTFFLAGVIFLRRFRSSNDVLYHAFSCFAFLFFESEYLFGFSRLWDVTWWYWHVLKLLVYAGLAIGLAHGFTRTFYDLRDSRLELMDVVQRLRTSYENLKDAQRQLVESEKLASIGRLASTIAHEIRNPLGAIANSVGVFRRRRDLSGEEGELLTIVDKELGRLDRFITQFLAFARPSSLEFTPADVNEVIDETLDVFSMALGKRTDIALVKHVDELPEAVIDSDAIKQCLWNLLNNASQAMPRGGLISVRAFHTVRPNGPGGKREEIGISVCDSGEGIPDDRLSQIFQPFFSTKARGTGLGLAIVEKIVAQHGGSVSVTSKPKQGSEFHLTLPLNGPAAPASAEAPRYAAHPGHR